ncbi:MAG TPA: hypothetical protein VHK06_03820 [Candidatus Limnocylindria bacterium]|nr:hypothetical protein [Candidatus Limnocylindria bacterium]
MLPLAWTLFAVSAVAAFMMLAAYWLDVQDRPDLSRRARMAWSAAAILFPLAIPLYAFVGGPGWPAPLRVASLVPPVALALFFGFALGLIA